jgi:hypothetical protein
MDVFDSYHICNHSDGEGRYAYKVGQALFMPVCKLTHNSVSTKHDVGLSSYKCLPAF